MKTLKDPQSEGKNKTKQNMPKYLKVVEDQRPISKQGKSHLLISGVTTFQLISDNPLPTISQ